MTTAVEQYRALVAKLEAINPSEPVNEAGYIATPTAYQPATGGVADAQAASNTMAAPVDGTSGAAPAEYSAPVSGQIPTLSGSFKQAYAEAVRQGLKKFKWCGVYSTEGQGPKPVPSPKTSNVQPRFYSQGPSDAVLKDKYGRPLPKANQDLIRQSYDDSTSAGGASG